MRSRKAMIPIILKAENPKYFTIEPFKMVNELIEMVEWGQKDGSIVKSVYRSSRGIEFSSKYSVTSVLGDLKPLASTGTCTCIHIPTHRHTYGDLTKNNKNKSLKSNRTQKQHPTISRPHPLTKNTLKRKLKQLFHLH